MIVEPASSSRLRFPTPVHPGDSNAQELERRAWFHAARVIGQQTTAVQLGGVVEGGHAAVACIPLVIAEAVGADDVLIKLLEHTRQANAALMRGDADTYRRMTAITDDFILMSPFGGEPSRATHYTPEKWSRMGQFFKNGTHAQELVQAYSSPDMVVLALIERDTVEVGGLPGQEWALRVTLVYRREGTQWRLVHRHADPLANGISREQAAALARGAQVSE